LFVGFAAAFKVVMALGSSLFKAESVALALIGLVATVGLLITATRWLAPVARRRRGMVVVAAGVLGLSLLTAAYGMGQLVLARVDGVSMDVALAEIATVRHAAVLALCVAGLCWGLVCAATILAPDETTER